jgi:Polysaccharide pyruvyl transferase
VAKDPVRVLAVGAYERDNFGDELLLLVTERYLAAADVVASAPFAADMRDVFGRAVVAYAPLLRSARFPIVWTVGGEVGGVDVETAALISLPRDDLRVYAKSSPAGRRELLQRAVDGDLPLAPYIPSIDGFPLNRDAITVLNSAGISAVSSLLRDERLGPSWVSLLKRLNHVAVRDLASSRLLDRLGVAHDLVPDAVHTAGILWPRDGPAEDTLVFQASATFIHRVGLGTIADSLLRSASTHGLGVRLLAAGTAKGHDSLSLYRELARLLRMSSGATGPEIVVERDPIALARTIGAARVVVGTSLHVRVVAESYGVPRVSLESRKTSGYAQHWDPTMPFGVTSSNLDAMVGLALRQPRPTSRLADLADEHMRRLSSCVLGHAIGRRTHVPAS